MQSKIPVLIVHYPSFNVGAGPAGLIMAIFLAKNGIKVRIVDKEDTFHTGSRGFGIQPRTLELMKLLGIHEVQELATPIPTMRAYKLPGGTIPVKTWDLYEKGVTWPDRPYANGACLGQALLEEIIRKHLAQYDITVELGQELTRMRQTGDAVVATIRNHKSGETHEITADYLVGADGARGPTRKLLGLTFEGETKDTDGMVWGDVEIEGLGSDVVTSFPDRLMTHRSVPQYWHIWGKPGHFTIMARPLKPDSNTFGIGITGQNFDPTDLTDETKVKEFIYEQTGRTDLKFGDFSWLSYFKPNMRMVNKLAEGRAFIVGDAGHVHSPTGGQGMNTSVQDSSNLAWKLALVLKKVASPSILSTFDVERLPIIVQMLHATSALYTHTVLKVKDSEIDKKEDEDNSNSGWFRWRNSALEMYGINHRYSPIVQEERNTGPQEVDEMRARAYQGYEGMGSLQAGDRAPEAPGLIQDGLDTSLFALFKPSVHTVLIFTPDKDAPLDRIYAAAAAYPEGAVQTSTIYKDSGSPVEGSGKFVDRDGHAFSAYLVNKDMNIVVVRPDGFIGAIVNGADGMDRYFAKIFTASG
ncbi:FAD binding domain-containing protein [Mycena sp. CBHHK59/15]|nr:FAD binding domain-containing protein [Mycena sp. CBHHK59/15]